MRKKDNNPNTNDESSNNTKKENLSIKEEINQILNGTQKTRTGSSKNLEKKKINGKNKPLKDW